MVRGVEQKQGHLSPIQTTSNCIYLVQLREGQTQNNTQRREGQRTYSFGKTKR